MIPSGFPVLEDKRMARSSKKPRKNKLDPKQVPEGKGTTPRKEKDWSFEDILRSKSRRR